MVEKLVIAGYSTRMMAPFLFGTFHEIRSQFRYMEDPDRAQKRLAQLIRYHMQDKLRIDHRDWEPIMDGALWYLTEVMENRYQFDWRGYDPVKDRIEDNWFAIHKEIRRRFQWRLAHPFYAPYYTKQYGYRPLPGNDAVQEMMSFYQLEKEK